MQSKSLSGRKILDCSTLLPGPTVGKLLLEQGAEVTKIENPTIPDGSKLIGQFYNDLNENKQIISLDLTNPRDRPLFLDLVRQSDALIEGFKPETKMKLGLDFRTLHAIHPQLCVLSLVGFAEDSPQKNQPAHDLNFAALSGCLSLFSEMPALPLAHLFASYEGALSLTAALDSVSRGEKGSRIVISMLDTLKKVQSGWVRNYHHDRVLPIPGGTLFSGKFPCYRIYTALDGRRIAVGAIESKFWRTVCEILKLPELIEEGFAEGEKGAKVIQAVQFAFASKPWEEWAPHFAQGNCCVDPVLDYSEVYSGGL